MEPCRLSPKPCASSTPIVAQAVFNIALTLLAQTYTELDINYMNVTGSILSSFRPLDIGIRMLGGLCFI